MSDDLHTMNPRAAALQIEHHPAGLWLVGLLKCPPPEAARVRLRGRLLVQTWSAAVADIGATGICLLAADVVSLAGLLVTRERSSTGPHLRLDWLDGTGAPLPGSRSWSPPASDPGPAALAPAGAASVWSSQELASDVIRAQADLQRAHATVIAAGVRELSHGHVGQLAELRKTVAELQSIIIAQSQDLRQMASAAMKHESRGAARAYELALDHVQKSHEAQLSSARADSGDMELALAAELGPPLIALARDVAAVRRGDRPPSAAPPPPAPTSTAVVPSAVRLDAAQLEAAVLAVIRDAASGQPQARAIVSRVVGSLDNAQKMALGPLLMG